MTNEFMAASRRALQRLRIAQGQHKRRRARADRRFAAAEAAHAAELSQAEMIEAKAWMDMMSVPGVTIPMAAALAKVSESTVSRWVARHNRGLEETTKRHYARVMQERADDRARRDVLVDKGASIAERLDALWEARVGAFPGVLPKPGMNADNVIVLEARRRPSG